MSCLSLKKIPELNCNGELSILRVARTLNTALDTASLADLYDFAPDTFSNENTGVVPTADVTIKWLPITVRVDDGDIVSITDDCAVGDRVDQPTITFISYYWATIKNQSDRKWADWPVPCAGGDGEYDSGDDPNNTVPVSLSGGPVGFANPRVSGHGMPTFVPRAGGGGGDEEVVKDDCGPDSVRVKVYNASEKPIYPYIPVVFTGKSNGVARACIPWEEKYLDLPWAVLLPGNGANGALPSANATTPDKDNPNDQEIEDDENLIGCCIVMGMVDMPSKHVKASSDVSAVRITPRSIEFEDTGKPKSDEYYMVHTTGQGLCSSKGSSGSFILDRGAHEAASMPFVIGRYVKSNLNGDAIFEILNILSNGSVISMGTVTAAPWGA